MRTRDVTDRKAEAFRYKHMTYKSALVTGGAGFIGSHLVDALVGQKMKVFVVDDLSTGRKDNVNPKATFFKCSITSPAFAKVLRETKPDVVFHLAAHANVRSSVQDPAFDADVNILGTLALIQLAKEANIKKIIFSSTGGALYPNALRPPYTEKIPVEPISPYGIAKRSAEMYLAFAQRVYGLSCIILRYANVYGPRQNEAEEGGVVSIFCKQLLRSLPLTINGTGKQTRDFVYVDDVVRANLLAMQKEVQGTFNIGTGKQTSVLGLFRTLKKLTGSKAEEIFAPAATGEVMHSALDAGLAARKLGWTPRTSLDEGLALTVDWFKARL